MIEDRAGRHAGERQRAGPRQRRRLRGERRQADLAGQRRPRRRVRLGPARRRARAGGRRGSTRSSGSGTSSRPSATCSRRREASSTGWPRTSPATRTSSSRATGSRRPWTRGCVEAAVMCGMQASRAICGVPSEIFGEDQGWLGGARRLHRPRPTTSTTGASPPALTRRLRRRDALQPLPRGRPRVPDAPVRQGVRGALARPRRSCVRWGTT